MPEAVPVAGELTARLSFAEREEISCRRAAGGGVREIARVLGRAPSTISRELSRGTVRVKTGYRASVAQAQAEMRVRRPKVSLLARRGDGSPHVRGPRHAPHPRVHQRIGDRGRVELAADGTLPLAHSGAAASERGRGHRFGWREYAELPSAARVILSAACGTGGSHIVGLGEHLGIYNVLRRVGLRAFVAPRWDIVAADVLPILAEIRAGLLTGQEVRQAVRAALDRGVPAWSAHALILEGDWR